MKKFNRLLAVAATGALFAAPALAGDTFVRIVSGPAGGSWYPLGAKMSEIFSSVEGVAASNGPGGGVGNVLDVNNGEAEVGWTYGHTAFDGMKGNAPVFKKKNPNIRHLATLYPAALQTAVRKSSKITGYGQLKDKNLSPGKAKWSGYAAAQLVYSKYGFSVDDVKSGGGTVHHVSYTDSVSLMKDGHIDAFTGLTSFPQASFLDLEFKPGIRLLGVDDKVLTGILKENPGYIKVDLTKEHYKSLEKPITTLGAVTILVINKNVPDDIAYQLTKKLWDNHGEMVKVKGVWKSVKLNNALLGAALDVHPGAKRFYDEKGVK